MSLITPEELKSQMELQGVDSSLLEDETTLQNLIDLKIKEIISQTGMPINPISRRDIVRNFNGNVFETNWYPIESITSFKINNTDIEPDDYMVLDSTGIILFNNPLQGFLIIDYTQKVKDEDISSRINPLISDMILYYFTVKDNSVGEVSSIHEMDTTVSYNTNNSLGNRIYGRINELKNEYSYSARVRWL